jgi:hypothetical protein
LKDLKRGLPCRIRGNNLTVQNGGISMDSGDGLCYGLKFLGVTRASAGKELDALSLFDGLDSVAIPLDLVLPGRASWEFRNPRC